MNLWSFARLELGLETSEFYAMTPRWFDALRRRHESMTEDREFLIAQLTSYVVNFSYRPPKEQVHPKDLMPSLMRKQVGAEPLRKHKRRRRSMVASEVRMMMTHFMQL